MLVNDLMFYIYQDIVIYTIDTDTDITETIYKGKIVNAPNSILNKKIRVIGAYDKNMIEISVF